MPVYLIERPVRWKVRITGDVGSGAVTPSLCWGRKHWRVEGMNAIDHLRMGGRIMIEEALQPFPQKIMAHAGKRGRQASPWISSY